MHRSERVAACLRTERQASVPELTKRTISMDGTLSITIFARVFCKKCRQNVRSAAHNVQSLKRSLTLFQILGSRVTAAGGQENHLQLARGSKGGTLVNLGLQGLVDLIDGVAGNGGTPAEHIVDVPARLQAVSLKSLGLDICRRTGAHSEVWSSLVVVDVVHVGTLDAVENDRLTTYRLEGPDRAVHATGE